MKRPFKLVASRSYLLLSPFAPVMNFRSWIFIACIACPVSASQAQVSAAANTLKVLPAPKEVHMSEGRLAIKSTTTILISNKEDRLAAEMLQKEIHDRTGMRLAIESVTAAPRTSGHISLGRLTDRGLRSYLESLGINAGDELGEQGYLIHVTDSGVLVAGRSAQGLFYGVQTLRQLLREEAGASANAAVVTSRARVPALHMQLLIPALTIRDWPSMEWRGVSDDISRGPIPTLEYLKYQIRTLSEYKINLLGLNMEHVFDFQTQPLVSPRDSGKEPALTSA